MFEVNPVINQIKEIRERTELLGGIFDYALKQERLEEVNAELEDPRFGMSLKKPKL